MINEREEQRLELAIGISYGVYNDANDFSQEQLDMLGFDKPPHFDLLLRSATNIVFKAIKSAYLQRS